ncbi:MAG: hypothetical protein WD766_11970 [Gemmatimonadota bacterium]
MTDLQLTTSQRELLGSLPERFAIERVDRIWIFSAHQGKLRETGLFVISLLPEPEQQTSQRTLFTLRYHTDTIKGVLQRTESLSEEGRAPPERIDRVIEGVLARAGEDLSEQLVVPIEGEVGRWDELLARVGLAGLT